MPIFRVISIAARHSVSPIRHAAHREYNAPRKPEVGWPIDEAFVCGHGLEGVADAVEDVRVEPVAVGAPVTLEEFGAGHGVLGADGQEHRTGRRAAASAARVAAAGGCSTPRSVRPSCSMSKYSTACESNWSKGMSAGHRRGTIGLGPGDPVRARPSAVLSAVGGRR
ncbi:MAG TPA: hypothetical protein VFU12_17400 [Glycomyces sp.]|nr:hypothetical protein [Glycomyces sp.]